MASKQLGYYQEWLSSLTQAPLQAVALEDLQAALRVVVSGFLDTTSAEVRQAGARCSTIPGPYASPAPKHASAAQNVAISSLLGLDLHHPSSICC